MGRRHEALCRDRTRVRLGGSLQRWPPSRVPSSTPSPSPMPSTARARTPRPHHVQPSTRSSHSAPSSGTAHGSTTNSRGCTDQTQSSTLLESTVPWRAEQRQMYERLRRRPATGQLVRSRRHVAAPSIGRRQARALGALPTRRTTGVHHRRHVSVPRRTRQRCVARRHDRARTPRRHVGRDRLARRTARAATASARWWLVAPVHARSRRPARHGWQLPTHVGARGAQDVQAPGATHLGAVSTARRSLDLGFGTRGAHDVRTQLAHSASLDVNPGRTRRGWWGSG